MSFVCEYLGCDEETMGSTGKCVAHLREAVLAKRREQEGETPLIPLSPPLEKGEAKKKGEKKVTEVKKMDKETGPICPDCGHKLTKNGKCMPCVGRATRAKKKAAKVEDKKASPSPQSLPSSMEGGEGKTLKQNGQFDKKAGLPVSVEGKGNPPQSPFEKGEVKEDGFVEITIDLSAHPEVYRQLVELAASSLRTVEMQALWLLMKGSAINSTVFVHALDHASIDEKAVGAIIDAMNERGKRDVKIEMRNETEEPTI